MNVKIVCSGMQSKKAAEIAKKAGGDQVEVTVLPDIQAANGVKNGNYDYYIGTCQTGGGGSLAMAIAILGMPKTKILGTPGRVPSAEQITQNVEQGYQAFGLPYDQIDQVIPNLVKSLIIRKHKLEGM
jgi:hypothetical protein